MEPNEIMMSLRGTAARWEAMHPIICVGQLRVHDALNDAADCIERLQAELEASKRREREAVEDIREIDRFNGKCLRCKSWNGARCKRGYSVNASFCHDWQWRGSEQEGE